MSIKPESSNDCPFRPPAPTPPTENDSIVSLLLKARKDLLPVIPEGTYKSLMSKRRFGLRQLFVVNSPRAVREILNKDVSNYPKSAQMIRALRPLVGDGVFISNGKTWRRRRRMVNPSLENVRLRIAFPMMQSAIQEMLDRFERAPSGQAISLDAEMAHVTADIIFRAIFSKKLTREESRSIFEAFAHYQEGLPQFDIVEMLGMPSWIPRRSMRKAKRAAEQIRSELRNLVEERLGADQSHQHDILSMLIDSKDDQGVGLSVEELVDEVAVLFLAGHETSATALTWAVFLAASQPDIAKRLSEEAASILPVSTPQFESISRLTLARDVFKESLRLYPPVSFITREALEDRKIEGKRIDRHSMVVISPWVIHRHRRFWKEPDCFIPDRYMEAGHAESEKQAYIPFGTGQRACPGASFAMMEGPMILANLFRNFDVRVSPGTKPYPVCRLTTRPREKVLVTLVPRSA